METSALLKRAEELEGRLQQVADRL